MAYSVYDLTAEYLNRFYEVEQLTPDIKRKALNMMSAILKNGWVDTEIIRELDFYQKRHSQDKLPPFARWLPTREGSRRHKNLLDPNKFYHHNELRILPPPPKRIMDYNEGVVRKQKTEFFMEMKSSYTVENLVNYYYSHFKSMTSVREARRLKGAFEYLLKHHTIEQILFMIDATSTHIMLNNMTYVKNREPFFIEECVEDAKMAYNEKRTEEVLAGDDKIVPKKRVLVGRSRYTSSDVSEKYMDS